MGLVLWPALHHHKDRPPQREPPPPWMELLTDRKSLLKQLTCAKHQMQPATVIESSILDCFLFYFLNINSPLVCILKFSYSCKDILAYMYKTDHVQFLLTKVYSLHCQKQLQFSGIQRVKIILFNICQLTANIIYIYQFLPLHGGLID